MLLIFNKLIARTLSSFFSSLFFSLRFFSSLFFSAVLSRYYVARFQVLTKIYPKSLNVLFIVTSV